MPGIEMVRQALKKLRKIVFPLPSCREASVLLSRAQDMRLTRRDRFRLNLHLSVCKACQNVVAQLAFIRAATKRYLGRDDPARRGAFD